MAKLFGGITGRPSGKVGNVIYGAARTRRGKSATARATFSPSNPNTPAQQAQRNRMRSLSQTAKRWNPTRGRAQWNTIEGNLPVYQSILRLLFQASDAQGDLSVPRPVSLGPTPTLRNLQIQSGGGSGVLLITWVAHTGDGALLTDQVQVFYTATIRTLRTEAQSGYVGTGVTRGADETTVSGLAPGTAYLIGLWVSPAAAVIPGEDVFPAGTGSEVQWLIGNTDV